MAFPAPISVRGTIDPRQPAFKTGGLIQTEPGQAKDGGAGVSLQSAPLSTLTGGIFHAPGPEDLSQRWGLYLPWVTCDHGFAPQTA